MVRSHSTDEELLNEQHSTASNNNNNDDDDENSSTDTDSQYYGTEGDDDDQYGGDEYYYEEDGDAEAVAIQEAAQQRHEREKAQLLMKAGFDVIKSQNEGQTSVEASDTYIPDYRELMDTKYLTELQSQALSNCNERSQALSDDAYPKLLSRFETLGFNEYDLKKVTQYIRHEAPLISHFNPTHTLPLLLKDTHFRSLWETGYGNGGDDRTSRQEWESSCFGGAYDSCADFERCKYGVVNLTKNPQGLVALAGGYGPAFFEFQGIRLRTTFAFGDTADSNAQATTATCEFFNHILLHDSDELLKDLVKVAKHEIPFSTNVGSSFKEIQIHGEVRLDTHIKQLNMPDSLKSTMETQAKQFCERNKCALNWVDMNNVNYENYENYDDSDEEEEE